MENYISIINVHSKVTINRGMKYNKIKTKTTGRKDTHNFDAAELNYIIIMP